jgi:hypothetical protein
VGLLKLRHERRHGRARAGLALLRRQPFGRFFRFAKQLLVLS